jgi:O-antigen/teichoic acid export membrane protein
MRKIQLPNLRYLSNLAATFLSQSISALSILLLTPVLVKHLGAAQFGLYGVFLNIIVLSSVLDFWLNIGLLRRLIHNRQESPALINTLFFFFLGLFVVSVPVFFALYYYDILRTGEPFLLHALLTGLLVAQTMIALLFDTIIQTANKIFVGKLIRIGKLALEFVALYVCCRLGSVTLLLLVSAAVNFLYIGLLWYYSKREVDYRLSVEHAALQTLGNHIKYSFWYFQAAIATVLVFNAQVLMINGVLGTTSVAKYLLVTRFFDVIRIGLTNFTQVLFPKVVYIEASARWQEIWRLFRRVMLRIAAISLLVFLGIVTIGEKVFVYWSKYSDMEILHLYRFLAIFILLVVIDNVSVVFLSALKLNKLPTIVSIGQGILGLGLGYLWLKQYGVVGVAAASLVAFVGTNMIFNTFYLVRGIRRKLTQFGHE